MALATGTRLQTREVNSTLNSKSLYFLSLPVWISNFRLYHDVVSVDICNHYRFHFLWETSGKLLFAIWHLLGYAGLHVACCCTLQASKKPPTEREWWGHIHLVEVESVFDCTSLPLAVLEHFDLLANHLLGHQRFLNRVTWSSVGILLLGSLTSRLSDNDGHVALQLCHFYILALLLDCVHSS